ncbi:MAG: hypothetical protein RIT45_1430 [Pseudomonadota bacterium]|jgi:butyryl-CoA dehydrogenase
MRELKDKVVALTGAGSGIGRGLAKQLAAAGCRLALADIDAAGLDETIAGLPTGTVTHRTQLDVADRDAIYAWAEAVAAHFGVVHVIINNAGVALAATVEGAADADLHWLMDINFWGVVHGTRAFLPHLRAAGEGHVVNISSVFGLVGIPTQSAYCASKFAVRGFTESLRIELELEGAPIKATVVHPGGIKTAIARRARSVEDGVANLMGMGAADSQRDFERFFITTPDAAAQTILKGIRRDARRVLIGPDAWGILLATRIFPTAYQRILEGRLRRDRARLRGAA